MGRLFRPLVIAGIGLMLLLSQSALAQPEVGNGSPNAAAVESAAPVSERTIYIPFKDLNAALGSPSAKIVLPYRTYQELQDQIRSHQLEKVSPGAILSSARYQVTAEESFAIVAATLKFEVLRPGATLPVNFADAAIGSAVLPDGSLLRGDGAGKYTLIFPKAGTQVVDLKLSVRISQSPAGREITINCPLSAVTELDVTVPQTDQFIEVTPDAVQLKADAAEGDKGSRAKAQLGATSKIQVRWHTSTSNAPEMNLLTNVNTQTLVTIADGQVHTHSWLTYDILRGELNQVRIAIPAASRLLDVSSETRIRNWKVEKQNGNQIVVVDLLQPVTKQFRLELDAEAKLGNDPVIFGGTHAEGGSLGVQPLDAVRVSGQLAVRHSPDLSVNVNSMTGLIRLDANDAAPVLKGTNALLFRFYTNDYALNLRVQPVLPRIGVNQQTAVFLRKDDLRFEEQFQFQVERIGVFELKLRLPADVTIDNVTGKNVKGFRIHEGILTIELNEQVLGTIPVLLTGRRPLPEAGGQEFPLPVSTPEGVERSDGVVVVYSRDALEVQTPLESVQSAQPMAIHAAQQREGQTPVSAWSYSRHPVVIPVRIQQKPTRLSATVETLVDVQPEITRVKSTVDFLVEQSPVNTFRIEVPGSISAKLQIDAVTEGGVALRQKVASEPVDGKVIWTMTMQSPVQGHQKFNLVYDLPTTLITGADAAAGGTVFPLPRPLGLVNSEGTVTTPIATHYGEVAVQKDRGLSLTSAQGTTLEQVDPRELKLITQPASLAYRYYRDDAEHPATVAVATQRFEVQNVVSTIISQGLVEIVTSQDSQATYRCRYRVQTSERQRLLVALPENLEVLSILLNDRDVKLEKAGVTLPQDLKLFSPYWLNIHRPENSDVPFMLSFQFLWNVNPALGESQFGSGKLQLPLPVVDVQGHGVVQELKVVIWVPEKYRLVGNATPFQLQTVPTPLQSIRGRKPDRNVAAVESWIADGKSATPGTMQFPTEGREPYIYTTLGQASQIEVRWWHRLGMTVIFSVAAALIGWTLLGTSWENRLGVLLCFVFIAALYGMADQSGLYEVVSAAKYGLALILAIWLLHSLLRRPDLRRTKASAARPAPVVEDAGGKNDAPPSSGEDAVSPGH